MPTTFSNTSPTPDRRSILRKARRGETICGLLLLPVLLLPFLFTRTHGLRTTRQMAQALGEELGY